MARDTNSREDKEFADRLKEELDLLHDYSWVLEWVEENFDPEDVFSESALAEWAEDNGYVLWGE